MTEEQATADAVKQAEHQFLVVAIYPNHHGERSVETAATVRERKEQLEAGGALVVVTYLGRYAFPLHDGIMDGYTLGPVAPEGDAAPDVEAVGL